MRIRINVSINILISFIAILSLFGCDNSQQKKPHNYPESLIILSNATNIKYYEIEGSLQLAYKLKAAYPATTVIEQISYKLKQDNWKALEKDFLNPGISSSQVTGWSSFEDATKIPSETVHLWIADWQNKSGDILRYGFQYRYEKNKKEDLSNLIVNAIFIPAAFVKEDLKSMEKYNQKHGEIKTK